MWAFIFLKLFIKDFMFYIKSIKPTFAKDLQNKIFYNFQFLLEFDVLLLEIYNSLSSA